MNAKKNALDTAALSGPQPLNDEDLGTAVGGCGHHKKKHRRTSRYSTRRTSDWRRSGCGRDSRYSKYSRF